MDDPNRHLATNHEIASEIFRLADANLVDRAKVPDLIEKCIAARERRKLIDEQVPERNRIVLATRATKHHYIDVVFDGPPGHDSGRFVWVEDPDGHSIAVGTWLEREDGYWALRIPGCILAGEPPPGTLETPGAP